MSINGDYAIITAIDGSNNNLNTINTTINDIDYIQNSTFSLLGQVNEQQQYNIMSMKFDTNTILSYNNYSYTNTGVSVDVNSSSLFLSSNANTIQFQSKKRVYYESGKNTSIIFNAKLYEIINANSMTRFGLYDNNNGIYIGYNGIDIYVAIRSNTTGTPNDTIIPRISFNKNILSGFDFTKLQQFKIDVMWNTFFRLSVLNNGKLLIAHEQYFNNISTVPFLQSYSLPFRTECLSTIGTQNLYLLNMNVYIDGGNSQVKRTFNLNNPDFKNRTINTDGVPIIAIRINPIYNNSTIRIKSIEMSNFNTGGVNNQVCWFYGMILYYDADNGLAINGGTTHMLQDSIAEYIVEPDSISYVGTPKQLLNKFMASGPNTNFAEIVKNNFIDNEISTTLSGNSDYFVLFGKTNTDKTEVYYNVVIEEIY